MMQSSRPRSLRHAITVISALLWSVLVLGLYYWGHKPLTPALAGAVGGAILDVVVAALFVLVAGGVGRRLLRRLDLSPWSDPERVAAAGLLGLSALSLLIFGVGAIMLNALSVALLLFVAAALTWRDLIAWAGELRGWLRHGLPREHWPRFLALAVLIMLLIALALALLPPGKWDVLAYHLAGPQQYVEHGRFYAVRHNHFLGFPQLVETLYAAQLALTGRLTGSAPLHWGIGVFALMLAGGYAARRAGEAAGWMAAAVLLAATSIWLEMTFAYTDLMPIGLAVMALALAERWDAVRHGESAVSPVPPASFRTGLGYLILIGVVVGLGMSTKYTALWMGAAFGVLVVWLGRRDGWRASLAYGLIYAAAAVLVLAPWLIRNTIWYHNPLYPLVFQASDMDSIRQDWYSQPESGLAYGSNAWQIPVLPLTATFFGFEGAGIFGTDAGPLFLILVPLVVLAWGCLSGQERVTVRRALLVAGVITAAWILSSAVGSYISLQTRLVFYLFGPLAVVSGIALEGLRRLPKKPLDVGFVLQALVGLTVVFAVIGAVRALNDSGAQLYFSGETGYESAYLEHALGWHYATMRQIDGLPQGTTVRFLWEPRTLYCDNRRLNCYTDSLMDAWYYARRTVGNGSPAAIAERWKAGGADYLLVYEFGREYEKEHAKLYTQADWEAWDVFVRDYLAEEWRNGSSADEIQYILYRWRE
jgi:4-amino-4-deoxy-L-arabinose transferase-like glycosyltransferase